MSVEPLKRYQTLTIVFLIGNLFVMGVDQYFINTNNFNPQQFFKSVPFPAVSVIGSYVLNGLLSSELKYKIVFLRWKNPLPGSRLKQTIRNDSRFTLDRVVEKFGPIPEDPKDQNVFWFQKIYKPIQNEEKVRNTHKSFLLTRDLTGISALLLIASIIYVATFSSGLWIIFVLVIEFLLLRLAASNYGKRLVCTVIANNLD
jgi:hypothetical protein